MRTVAILHKRIRSRYMNFSSMQIGLHEFLDIFVDYGYAK
jgi:hypothetical protein